MRGMVVLGAGMALMTAGQAGAQQMGQHGPGAGYPMPGAAPMQQPMPMPTPTGGAGRWGSNVGGHWSGGVNAPGGMAAYRTPYRGYRVPTYWVSPRFVVTNWSGYGLPAPTGGNRWARYYDDAVLIDRGGSVYDYSSGLDWDGVYDGVDRRASSGVGGAVAGAVVGGVAGNLIGGRGNRLAGTLVGAGVGGAAGYALDRSSNRAGDRRGPPPPRGGYGDEYRGATMAPAYDQQDRYRDAPGYRGGGYPTIGYPGGPSSWVSPDGRTTVTTTTGGGYAASYGGGYDGGYQGGYSTGSYGYAGGGSVTTVTVQSQPVVTTTTTETIEDSVTYSRPVVRRVYRQRVFRTKSHPRIRARCACGS